MALARWYAAMQGHGRWAVGSTDRCAERDYRTRVVLSSWAGAHCAARFHQETPKDAGRGPEVGTEAEEGCRAMSKKKRVGSSLDDFLKEEEIFDEAQAQA